MSALTSIFNFLYVYLRAIVCYIFGNLFSANSFTDSEQIEIARSIVRSATNGQFENGLHFSGEPILLLIFGIFALGSIIGLVRRLIR